MATKIRKRNGVVVAFDASKIKNAVKKANDAVKEEPMDDAALNAADQPCGAGL